MRLRYQTLAFPVSCGLLIAACSSEPAEEGDPPADTSAATGTPGASQSMTAQAEPPSPTVSAPATTQTAMPSVTPTASATPTVTETPTATTEAPTPTAVPTETATATATEQPVELPPDPELEVQRELLSQTGLYADILTEELGNRVLPYSPQFELWTDGAEKYRWVHIPEGEQIDSSDVDEWKFPVGTKLWKEFRRDGVRIETRLIEKLPPERAAEGFEGWLVIAYIWNEEGTDAVASPMGAQNVHDTPHDVPDQDACGNCHDMRVEKPLGFSAVQLNHDGEGATLASLLESGWLSDPPPFELTVPGNETEQALVGYLHANCGHCHRQNAPVNNRVSSLRLWLESESLMGGFQDTEAYQALVGAYTQSGQGSINAYRVVPGDPETSELMRRIAVRADSEALADAMLDGITKEDVPMPPLGTEDVDPYALELIRDWILSLPPLEPASEEAPAP